MRELKKRQQKEREKEVKRREKQLEKEKAERAAQAKLKMEQEAYQLQVPPLQQDSYCVTCQVLWSSNLTAQFEAFCVSAGSA